MGVMKRLSEIFQAKSNKLLDKAEDPRETLDLSYQKQLESLQKVRRSVADVTTAKKRIELQAKQLQSQADKLQQQAKSALTQGNEPLARVSGVSESMSDAGLAMQRAQDKIDSMQARAGAMDELLASGVLTDLSHPVDDIQAQLDKASVTTEVDAELAALKSELAASAPAAELEAPTATGSEPALGTSAVGSAAAPDPVESDGSGAGDHGGASS